MLNVRAPQRVFMWMGAVGAAIFLACAPRAALSKSHAVSAASADLASTASASASSAAPATHSLNASSSHAFETAMPVTLFTGGGSSSMHAYKIELITRALELTSPEFGAYQLGFAETQWSYKRASALLERGEAFNLTWAPMQSDIPHDAITALNLDYSRGILGYRACLIDRDHAPNTRLSDVAALRNLRIGIGAYWPDTPILKHNQLDVLDHADYDQLFVQLKARRFDCIPLGIGEIQAALDDKQAQYPSLGIDPHLMFYYPYPMRFYVSNQHPKLIERLNLGFKRLSDSGEFERTFARHHQNLDALDLSERHLVCLKNPYDAQDSAPHDCVLPDFLRD